MYVYIFAGYSQCKEGYNDTRNRVVGKQNNILFPSCDTQPRLGTRWKVKGLLPNNQIGEVHGCSYHLGHLVCGKTGYVPLCSPTGRFKLCSKN